MAKKMGPSKMGPSKAQERRWRAEDLVRQSIINSPGFKKAVQVALKELKQAEKAVASSLKKP